MNKQTLDEAVSRFLSWPLPHDFAPDGGVSYTRHHVSLPTGTNLLTATQARAMLEYVLDVTPRVGVDTRTSFQQVADMNEAFGNPKGDFNFINAARLMSQCKNIIKEYEELMLAFDEASICKIRDALCDIQVFAMGAQHLMGVDGDRDMRSVVNAVMTRFCATPAQLAATEAHFNKLGVSFYSEGEFPRVCLKSSADQGYYNGSTKPEYPKGKFLKSVGYEEPLFYTPAPSKPTTQRKFMSAPPTAVVNPPVALPVAFAFDVSPVAPVPAETPADIVRSIAEDRAAHMLQQTDLRKMIDAAVEQFRGELEKKAYGFQPFDGNKNNTTALGG